MQSKFSKEQKILFIILFNMIIIFSEILFGIISNSFALIADALHNTGDVIAVVITLIALKVAKKSTDFQFTFGFIKAEMMAAFINTSFLFLTMIYLLYESFLRLFEPQVIDPVYMIIVGMIAVVANGISAYILHSMEVGYHHHHSREHHNDANIYSAYLHMLADAMVSVAVVVAGVFIYLFQIYFIDSVLTIVFSGYILVHSYPLLKKSFYALMDSNTMDISKEQLDAIILENTESVLQYNDLHIYSPNSKENYISFHLIFHDENTPLSLCETINETIRAKLKQIGFTHILIQNNTQKFVKDTIFVINQKEKNIAIKYKVYPTHPR